MDVTPKKWSTKKIVAIALMALAFIMLNISWIKIDSDVLDAVDEMRDDLERTMERQGIDIDDDDVKDALEDIGYSKKEAKAIIKAYEGTEKMLDALEKGSYSVWTIVSLNSAMGDMTDVFTDEDSLFYDRDAEEAISMLSIMFGIIIAVFALTGLLMILAILSHVRNKRGLGIPATILSILLAVIFALLGVVMKTEFENCRITAAPILTAVFALASCIAWAGARKEFQKTV